MSFEQLRSIIDEDAQRRHLEEVTPPVACPHDGEPLLPAKNGLLYCPFGDYQWPHRARTLREAG